VIAGLSYLFGELFKRLRQPEVIGQLLAGIVIGPSLLGRFFGGVTTLFFPASIIPYLNVTSQIALILFLFAVGYELDLRLLRKQRKTVLSVAASTFAVPMLLGAGSVYLLGRLYRMAGEPRVGNSSLVLFMGVALSISALPVMASIMRERGIAASLPGVTAMTSAAIVDALGWLALAGALVLASVSSAHRPWIITILLLAGYIAVVILVIRPILSKWLHRPKAVLANKAPIAVVVAASSAWVTAALGLHVIFGAIFAGIMMPRLADGTPDENLLRPVQEAGGILLPLFFVISGLSVNIGALHPQDLVLFGAFCAFAVIGKIGAGFLAARVTGMSKRDSSVVGVLLNTRGLTELIALNVGLQIGIIHQRLYTILVLMALVTTAATGPLLKLTRLPQPEPALPVVAAMASDIAVADG
jgi:Kef-type K+ transport system membrane component KefB